MRHLAAALLIVASVGHADPAADAGQPVQAPVVHFAGAADVHLAPDTYLVPGASWRAVDSSVKDMQDRDTSQKAQIKSLTDQVANKPIPFQALIWVVAGLVAGAGTVVYLTHK